MAFYSKNNNAKELLVYGIGEPIFRLNIDENLCLNGQCTTKADFVAKYLNELFPENTLDEILEARPVAIRGSHIVKTADGFEQTAKNENYDVSYKSDKNGVVFIEKNRNIIIKIKEVEE